MLFTPKPQFRGRKLFFKNYFLPSQTINPKSNSCPLHHLSPHNWRHQNAQESSVIQVNIERKKKLTFSFKKQPSPQRDTQSTKEFFSQLVRVYYYQRLQRALGLIRPACALLLTLHHLNPRMAFQCLRILRAAVVFKCNKFKIQAHTHTHTRVQCPKE